MTALLRVMVTMVAALLVPTFTTAVRHRSLLVRTAVASEARVRSNRLGAAFTSVLAISKPSRTGRQEPGAYLALVVVDSGGKDGADSLAWMQTQNSPALLMMSMEDKVSWQTWEKQQSSHQPRAAVMLIFLAQGNIRLRLTRLLNSVQRTGLWDQDRTAVVVLPENDGDGDLKDTLMYNAMAAERSLARKGMFRSILLISSEESIFAMRLTPYYRPQRLPLDARYETIPSAMSVAKAVFSFHGVVVTLYTETEEDEQACLEGHFDWTLGPTELLARTMATAMHIRPLCFSRRGQLSSRKMSNGTWTGLARSLQSGRSDALFFGLSLDADAADDFAVLRPNDFQSLCAYVRHAAPVPFLRGVVRGLGAEVWAAAGVALAGLAAARVIEVLVKYGSDENDVVNAVLVVWQAFISGGYPVYMQRTRRLALLGIGTTFFGIIFLNCFQGSFTSFLSVPRFESHIRSLKKLDKITNTVHVVGYYVDKFHDDEDPIVRSLAGKFQAMSGIDSIHDTALQIASGKVSDALLLLSDEAKVVMRWRGLQALTRNFVGQWPLERVEQCLLGAQPKSFAVRRGSPYAHTIGDTVGRLVETGILAKIWQITDKRMAVRYDLMTEMKSSFTLQPFPLPLILVAEAFYVLFGGLFLAVVCFNIEKITHKKKLRKSNNKKT